VLNEHHVLTPPTVVGSVDFGFFCNFLKL